MPHMPDGDDGTRIASSYSYDDLPNQEPNQGHNDVSFVSSDLLNAVDEFTRIFNEWDDDALLQGSSMSWTMT